MQVGRMLDSVYRPLGLGAMLALQVGAGSLPGTVPVCLRPGCWAWVGWRRPVLLHCFRLFTSLCC